LNQKEKMVEIDVVKAMWSGHPDRLKLARREAWLLKTAGKPLEAHSTMLSAYLSVRGGGQYGKVATAWHDALMTWHAYRLTRNKTWKSLNHNQLDVLISFWINILEWTREAVWFIDVLLNDLASRELQLVHDRDNQAKPHQIALAHIRKAEVCLKLRHPWFKNDAIQHVYIAEGKEAAIRNEEGQPQDLFSFLKKFFKEVKPFKSATIWFRPSPQQDDDGKKLKFFKQTYVLLMDGEGKNIELKKDYAETILHLRKNIKGNYDSIVECGEGYSAIKCLLKELF
jgi:hypothetical protein